MLNVMLNTITVVMITCIIFNIL